MATPSSNTARLYTYLAMVQVTCAVYNLLSKWALTKGDADPLVYCFYRDLFACPLLFGAAV